MMPNLSFTRILGALAVLAALSLAPSLALAHPGHAHRDAAASAQKAPAAKAAPAELRTASVLPAVPADDAGCNGYGCCASGPCTGCHGFVLTLVIDPIPPATVSLVLDGGAPPGRHYRDGRLRRPPKSFV